MSTRRAIQPGELAKTAAAWAVDNDVLTVGEIGVESDTRFYSIICWQPHVPLTEYLTGPGRWRLVGSSIEDLSLVAGSSSVQLQGGCNAHFFIQNGEVVNA